MKIYFASDAHLGARFHKDPLAIEKKLVRWLDSIKEDASAIWFLGDLFDLSLIHIFFNMPLAFCTSVKLLI